MTVLTGEHPIIDARSVSFRYESSASPVLDRVNLEIRRGEFVALIGQNGAGKTTLAKTFNGLLQPTSGELRVDGQDTRSVGLSRLARIVGYVYQNPDHQIFARTVRDEVAFGPRNLGWPSQEVSDAVEQALDLVGMRDEAGAYPFELGRGQRQKLAVASVIAMGPPVMVVDEPTTGLDLRGSLSIMGLLRTWNTAGRTIIIITHDMNIVAEFARRVVVMTRGTIVADGETRAILTDGALLADASLSVPQITRIAQRLEPRYRFPRDVLTVDEFRIALAATIAAGERH